VLGRDESGVRINICKNDLRTAHMWCISGGHEGYGRDDYGITCLQVQAHRGQMKRGSAIGAYHSFGTASHSLKSLFEIGYRGAGGKEWTAQYLYNGVNVSVEDLLLSVR
jgi:hypothetical protein